MTLTVVKDRVVAGAYALGWTLVRRLPESWARAAFMVIAEVAWRRQGTGVQRLEANLRRVIGPAAPGKQLRSLSRAGLRSYARYYLEVFRLPVMTEERIVGHMRCTGHEVAFDTMRAGRGVIFALPHMGNYDHAGAWIAALGAPFTTVAERLKPESLFDRFVAFREGLGMEVLPHTGGRAFGVLAQRLRAGRLVCLVSERDLTASGIEVRFFGETARMPAGPAALAVQTGAALMPVTLWYEGNDWRARVHEEVPIPPDGTRQEKTAAMTQSLATVWEQGIAEHPEDWHMLQRMFVADLDPDRLPVTADPGS